MVVAAAVVVEVVVVAVGSASPRRWRSPLMVRGAALQGTLGNEAGSAELTSVMLEGNKVTFTAARQTQRGSFELTYTGEIGEDGDTMTGTFEVPQGGGFTIPWTATRTDDN